MAGIFNGPPRGGTRGGRDQFSWENVRADKDREYYLGHSVKAVTGRWQKHKDVYWYTRDVDAAGQDAAAQELTAVKQREQDLMMEALGVKPKAPKPVGQAQLDKQDMQKLLHGGDGDEDDAVAKAAAEADRVRGLGYHASMTAGTIQGGEMQEMLAGVGAVGRNDGGASARAPLTAPPQQHGLPGSAGLSSAQIAEVKRLASKEEKRSAKLARKEAKRAKKDRTDGESKKKERKKKKRRKEKRAHRPSGSSSSDDSRRQRLPRRTSEQARSRQRDACTPPPRRSRSRSP